jgi:outer membrane protein TolC
MKDYSLLIIIVLLLFIETATGQELPEQLRMDDAVAIALENNHDIRLSKNLTEIATNNAVRANADYLPTVGLSGSYNYSSQNTYSEFAGDQIPPIDVRGAGTQNINAGINVNYNIFSGGSRKYRYEKLQTERTLSELQERQSIELTVSSVIGQYINLINLNTARNIRRESVILSNDRYSRSFENYRYGNIGKLQLLNAEVDLSNDSSALVQSQIDYEKGKNELCVLMGISPETNFEIDTMVNINESLLLEEFLQKALEQNSNYLAQKARIESAAMDVRINNAQKLPNLSLSGGYAYARSDFEASFITQSENLGWNAGLTLSYNIFDGNRVNRNEQNAILAMKNQDISSDQLEKNLQKDIYNAYEDYAAGLDLIKLRENNLELAEANYERSKDAFSTGQITGIELREAQLNLLNARYQFTLQKLQTKSAEIRLYYLSGSLVE